MTYSAFVAAVNSSFLSEKDKEEFRRSASEASEVDDKAWAEFNERLIEHLVHTEAMQQQYLKTVDEEINKFTSEYEKEKTVIDVEFRKTLLAVEVQADAGLKEKLWIDYKVKIAALQSRLLDEMKNQSTTILHDVAVFTAAEQEGHKA